jgi:hypothetical protein
MFYAVPLIIPTPTQTITRWFIYLCLLLSLRCYFASSYRSYTPIRYHRSHCIYHARLDRDTLLPVVIWQKLHTETFSYPSPSFSFHSTKCITFRTLRRSSCPCYLLYLAHAHTIRTTEHMHVTSYIFHTFVYLPTSIAFVDRLCRCL